MDINEIAGIEDIEQLETAITEANTAAQPLIEQGREGTPLSAEQRAELQGLFDLRDAARERMGVLAEAQAAEQRELDELLNRADEPAADEPVEPVAETTPEAPAAEAPAEPVVPAEPAAQEAPAVDAPAAEPALVAAGADRPPVVTAPRRRPTPPAKPTTEAERAAAGGWGASTALVASTNVASAAGQVLNRGENATWGDAESALIEFSQRLPVPSGDGKGRRLEKTQLVQMRIARPDEFILTGDEERDAEKVRAALDPRRSMANGAEGLVAAGGWCAPSEILYDIPVVGENATDGILSLPEMVASRGGVKSTYGPVWSDVYANIGFHQTETQAIAGDTKDCYEVPCTSFTETRLDIEGVCLIVPILTEAGYPELVQRYMTAASVVHARKMNAFKIAQIVANSTPKSVVNQLSTFHTTLDGLAQFAEYQRYQWSMGFNDTMEAVLPHWILNYLITDLELRTGHDPAEGPLGESDVKAWFGARNIAVQFVYQYQNMAEPTALATTFKALMYPAGTWLGLTKDVINLGAVYDSNALSTNVYTGTFSEEGVAVRKMTAATSYEFTFNICSAGRTGAANLSCS